MERYEGWRNHETLQAAWWLDNSGKLKMLRQNGNLNFEAIYDLLKEMTLREIPESDPNRRGAIWGTLLQDIAVHWLSQVDVLEILDHATQEAA
jgi:hypothetical protein